MSAPLFVLPAAVLDGVAGADATLVLGGTEGRHAATVRRLTAGERVDVTDGAGRLAQCLVAEPRRDSLLLRVLSLRAEPPPAPRLVVVQALPKGDRGELAVETMTEVGVDVVVPWSASRCVTQWRGERAGKARAKWVSAAHAAAKQSRRPWFPDVRPLATTAEIVSLLGASALGIVLHEAAAVPLSTLALPTSGDVVVVVGPEGGVADDELAAFATAGAAAFRLGPTVLRTSTAGVAALSLLLARTSRWG